MYKRTIYDYRERINKARDIAMKKSNRKLLSMGGFIEKITLRRIVASTFTHKCKEEDDVCIYAIYSMLSYGKYDDDFFNKLEKICRIMDSFYELYEQLIMKHLCNENCAEEYLDYNARLIMQDAEIKECEDNTSSIDMSGWSNVEKKIYLYQTGKVDGHNYSLDEIKELQEFRGLKEFISLVYVYTTNYAVDLRSNRGECEESPFTYFQEVNFND